MKPVFLLTFVITCTFCQQWLSNEVPSPIVNYALCGRYAPSRICNPEGIISNDTADWFDKTVGRKPIKTLWVRHITSISLSNFSRDVFNNWSLYDMPNDKAERILLTVVVNNMSINIHAGIELTSKFSEKKKTDIMESMIKVLPINYDESLRIGTARILDELYSTPVKSSVDKLSKKGAIIMTVGIIVFILVLICFSSGF